MHKERTRESQALKLLLIGPNVFWSPGSGASLERVLEKSKPKCVLGCANIIEKAEENTMKWTDRPWPDSGSAFAKERSGLRTSSIDFHMYVDLDKYVYWASVHFSAILCECNLNETYI